MRWEDNDTLRDAASKAIDAMNGGMLHSEKITLLLAALAPLIAAQERGKCAFELEAEGHHIAASLIAGAEYME